ncbi:MAG: hypothetical protein M3O31_15755 [Acidobacteriota bacterium]|nr:hypothetical protein [Acidobacteriota bacterium]
MSRLRWIPLILLVASSVHAEVWKTTKQACEDAHFFHGTQLHNAEECGVDFFTLDPIGPAIGSIATGSSFGGGFHFVKKPTANNGFTVKALYTLNSSFLFGGQYQLNFRAPHAIVTGRRPDGHGGQTDTTNGNLFITAAHFDLHAQDFYGLGPNSTLTGHAVYRQHETWFGAQGYSPLTSFGNYFGIFGVSGQLKYVHPAIGGVNGDSFSSVRARYGEAGAPSSTVNPDFIAVGAGVDVRTPTSRPRIWEHHEAQATYTHYSELGSSQFSFHRLEAFTSLSFDVSKSLPKTAPGRSLLDQSERSWWSNALCMENSRRGCDIGSITSTTLLTISYTSAGSSVPFYLQPTLGGADFEGVDTLRGLVDYRLRAPNRLLTQIDFDKAVANLGVNGHPIGQYGLYAFFDAGNVALTPGQLTAQGLRTDAGVGVSIAIQNKLVFRAYIAFGAGEGSHINGKAANTFALTPQSVGSWIP